MVASATTELCLMPMPMPMPNIEAAAGAFAQALIARRLIQHVRRIQARVHADPYDDLPLALENGLGDSLPFDPMWDLVSTGLGDADSSLELDALDQSGHLLFRQSYVTSTSG